SSNSDDSNSDDSNSDDSNSDDSNSDDSNSDDSNSDDSNSDDSNSDDSNSDDSSSDNTNLEHEPIIKLSKRSYTETFDFSSKTIDLYTFIDEIRNRKGEKILQKEVDIYLNGIKKDDHYLSNVQNSQEYSLTFKFLDDLSIITSNPIKLKYIKNRHELQSSESKNSLINSVSFSYEVTIPVAGELIYQINKLWAIDDDYRIVITPSLRTIFEICCQKINNFENIFDISEDNPKYIKSLEKKVEKCVEHILDYSKIRANTQFYRKITNEYDNFKNIYIPKDFEEAVKKSNLGSHYATTNLDNDKIQSIALHAGYFAQLIDAYLKDRGYT
ncbi:hypothetical protein, partial [Psychrobacter sp. 72-O-c]|uniref:hypothetical protein n=2 Tax=Psychrobacter sp. 72-O-c TaxID=2774125 RepID=UPI0019189461